MLDRPIAFASSLLRLPREEEELEFCALADGGGGNMVADVSVRRSGSGGVGLGMAKM